jgi:hypothetical protein
MIKGFHFFETMVLSIFAVFSPYTTTVTKVKAFFELWPAFFEISLYPQILLGSLSITHKHESSHYHFMPQSESESAFLDWMNMSRVSRYPLISRRSGQEKGSGISKYVLTLDRAIGIQSVWHESRGFILQEPAITLFPGAIGDR